jgi:hypothetical protein
MSQPSAIDTLVEAFTAVPEFDNPLTPIYAALSTERPLTLKALRQYTELLHDHVDHERDQTFAVNQVILSCKRISPTPLPILPLGF